MCCSAVPLPSLFAGNSYPVLFIFSRQKKQPWWWCSLCWKTPSALWLYCGTVQDQKHRGRLCLCWRDCGSGEGWRATKVLQLKNYFFHSQWIFPQSCAMGSRASLHWMKMLFFQTSEYEFWNGLFDAKGHCLQLSLLLNIFVSTTRNPKLLTRHHV